MTPDEIKIALALKEVSFPPATNQKRFAAQMTWLAENRPEAVITPKQASYLHKLAWRFRRQLPTEISNLGLRYDHSRASQKPRGKTHAAFSAVG